MKRFWVIVSIIIVASVGVLVFSGDRQQQSASTTKIPKQSKTNAHLTSIQSDVKKGALLVDVRTSQEYGTGHAKGAINISLQDIEAGTFPSQDKNATIYLYCRSGKRAEQAREFLQQAGFTNVKTIGGLSDWQAMGGPTESGATQKVCDKTSTSNCI